MFLNMIYNIFHKYTFRHFHFLFKIHFSNPISRILIIIKLELKINLNLIIIKNIKTLPRSNPNFTHSFFDLFFTTLIHMLIPILNLYKLSILFNLLLLLLNFTNTNLQRLFYWLPKIKLRRFLLIKLWSLLNQILFKVTHYKIIQIYKSYKY